MSIGFYNSNAESFIENTRDVDLSSIYNKVLPYLKDRDKYSVLDAGCGSGRDSKFFLELGYDVEAFDASKEMVRSASLYTGLDVKLKKFQEIDEVDRYDMVWCCSSLLHVPFIQLVDVFNKITKALTMNGIFYLSFKYGNEERVKEDRVFTDLNEEILKDIVNKVTGLSILEYWITTDVRKDRDEKWLNAVLIKK